jgi:succinate dehydrogenase/fumarate reductase flavoprotein subunit
VAGLFAAGECACHGVNGAGRLAGNTLTEAVVFGRKVGEAAARHAANSPRRTFPIVQLSDEEKRLAAITTRNPPSDSPGHIHAELGRVMHEKVGLVRDHRGLEGALDQIKTLKGRYQRLGVRNASKIYNYELTSYLELGSMLTVAEAVTLSAFTRKESRGAHRRSDFPERDDPNWKCHTIVRLVEGSAQLEKKPATVAG